jgi:hypothetical protein
VCEDESALGKDAFHALRRQTANCLDISCSCPQLYNIRTAVAPQTFKLQVTLEISAANSRRKSNDFHNLSATR